MEYLNDQPLLEYYLHQYHIPEHFSHTSLPFHLVRFQRGELVTSPLAEVSNILWLTEGSVSIYNIRSDAGISPIGDSTPPTIFGDIEFATGHPAYFYAEARTVCYAVRLNLSECEGLLREDVRFLNELLKSLGEKFTRFSLLEASSRTLNEQVMFYLEHFREDHTIHSVNSAVLELHCSRRQLQRVLAELCEEGKLLKKKKGCYTLLR